MAKSNHISGLLLLAIVCIHSGFGGNIVKGQNQVSSIRNQDMFPLTENVKAFKLNGASQQRALVKQIYDSQIGVGEAGVNRGPDVEKYLQYVKVSRGNPWCAAFVCWVFGQAGILNPRSAWSPDLFAKSRIIWPVENTPAVFRTGDVFGLYFTEKKRIAHAGFIDQQQGGWLITVEGNTSMSGGREGDGVYRKRRPIRSIYQVARYLNN